MSSPTAFRRTALALATVMLLAGAPAMAQEPLTAAEVRSKLEAQGYTHINDVEFDDGVWTADARSADGNRVELSIDPKTGNVYPDEQVANLGEDDVKARLAAAGYANVHDVEFENGVWKAEAEDAQGKDVELRMDPTTGEVIGKARD
ncbi:PepSY domain-containing protein [Luteimonas sp. SDU101]|uniref:PepSY domain-containing protein n=1 Tax=Luteimonas sp. SDU101 TaxID=3422593 RepID=UPI003EC06AA5